MYIHRLSCATLSALLAVTPALADDTATRLERIHPRYASESAPPKASPSSLTPGHLSALRCTNGSDSFSLMPDGKAGFQFTRTFNSSGSPAKHHHRQGCTSLFQQLGNALRQ